MKTKREQAIKNEIHRLIGEMHDNDSNGNPIADLLFTVGFVSGQTWADINPKMCWHDAEGEELPEFDREVIVLVGVEDKDGVLIEDSYKVCFGHRPDPKGWTGKCGDKIEVFYPKTFGKGGWNVEHVKFWLDAELPKEILK